MTEKTGTDEADRRDILSAENVAKEAVLCGCHIMGVVGAPFSGKERAALEMVRAIRSQQEHARVRTVDFSKDALPDPDPAYKVTLMLNLELLGSRDVCSEMNRFVERCGGSSYIVYTSCHYPGVGHFMTYGDLGRTEAMDLVKRNKAVHISSGQDEDRISAALPLNRRALDHLIAFIRDRSFHYTRSVETIMSWRSQVRYFDLEDEFGYLDRLIEIGGIDRQRFSDLCIMFYNSHMSSGYEDIDGLDEESMSILETMMHTRMMSRIDGAYVMQAYTSEVLRAYCEERIFRDEGSSWDARSFEILLSICKGADHAMAPRVLGMMVPATRHALRNNLWSDYSTIIRRIRRDGHLSEPSQGCRDVLLGLVGIMRQAATGDGPDKPEQEWYEDGELGPWTIYRWMVCKLIGVELDGPAHANMVQLKSMLDMLKADKVSIPCVKACDIRFRMRTLQDIPTLEPPSAYGLVLDEEGDERAAAGPVEVLEAFSAYMDVAIESAVWKDPVKNDGLWKLWDAMTRWLTECDCDDSVRMVCLIRLHNMLSRVRRKHKSYFGCDFNPVNYIQNMRPASDLLVEARLKGILGGEELRCLEQETTIEEAKVMINDQNVFMAESRVLQIVHDPADEITAAAANDCYGMMRLAMGDYDTASDYFRTAIDLYEAHLMRRKAVVCRARLMLSRAQDEDYRESKRMEADLDRFIEEYSGSFRYTSHLVSGFIRRTY